MRDVDLVGVDSTGENVDVTLIGVDVGPSSGSRRHGIRWTCPGTRCRTRLASPESNRAFLARAPLEFRHDRMTGVRAVLAGLADEALAGRTEPVDAPGGPQPRSCSLRGCLRNVLDEE
jgi:hypothetical protein